MLEVSNETIIREGKFEKEIEFENKKYNIKIYVEGEFLHRSDDLGIENEITINSVRADIEDEYGNELSRDVIDEFVDLVTEEIDKGKYEIELLFEDEEIIFPLEKNKIKIEELLNKALKEIK